MSYFVSEYRCTKAAIGLDGIKVRSATHDHIVRDAARTPDRTGSLRHHDVIGRRPLQAEDDTGIRRKWHHTEPDLSVGERLPEVDSFFHLIGRNAAICTNRDGEAVPPLHGSGSAAPKGPVQIAAGDEASPFAGQRWQPTPRDRTWRHANDRDAKRAGPIFKPDIDLHLSRFHGGHHPGGTDRRKRGRG